MEIKYSDDKSVQMLLKILKENNINKVIASPGTTNIAFVTSVRRDPYFEVYSCVDERSACYMACGLAVESSSPVVITCTGATASRNYFPGLTEAYYRKIPVLAVTCAPHYGDIDRNVPQALDRRHQPDDTVNLSVQIPKVKTKEDEYGCNLLLNKAILELTHNGGGPVHINLVTDGESNNYFTTTELPNTRIIKRVSYFDEFPKISDKSVGIFIGSHKIINDELTNQIDLFCENYNSVVLCDHTSNYNGKYRVLPNIILDQDNYNSELNNFDLLIYIGEVSGAYLRINSSQTWRVCEDGKLKDVYKNLTHVFEMPENKFFEKYNTVQSKKKIDRYLAWKDLEESLEKSIDEQKLPLSNIFVAKKLINNIPDGSTVHLAILNTLRSWNYFYNNQRLNFFSNTGGFGIDGFLSTMIGASLYNKKSTYYGVVGDLAFFYDLNSLGNNNVSNNIRIVLINNGCGTEFHNYSHPASKLEKEVSSYVAADGHFGKKSANLVKDYVTNLGFEYLSATNKEEFLNNLAHFTTTQELDRPIVFEIFTNSDDESKALKYVRSQKTSSNQQIKATLKGFVPPKAKKFLKKVVKGEE